ncbi:MAG: tyrosine transporter [Parachlamydiales bacterium]|nr:tyrosine transporter [Parachlamydiales bacterium]
MKTRDIITGSLLIGGTTIGAGMLGIPLVTGEAGFIPAIGITVLVWLFMYATGLLFLEATLWLHSGANVLSIAERFLGKKGRVFSGSVFVFLYYCLMIAYFAGGTPVFMSFITPFIGTEITGIWAFALFGFIFGMIVAFGLKFIGRVNYILMIGLVVSYVALIGGGTEIVVLEKLQVQHWNKIFYAAPILFAAFGYHNVIPSLTSHFHMNAKVMRKCILWGTLIPLVVYILWQWLIIGSIPQEVVEKTLKAGQPVTFALQALTGKMWIQQAGKFFSLFAIVTSMLGVSFSIVDFLGDGLKMQRHGYHRISLCFLTFVPPFIIATLDPSIFVQALGIAGGFGEAFLNGILPAWIVWIGRYRKKLLSERPLAGGKPSLVLILLVACFVMILEAIALVSH